MERRRIAINDVHIGKRHRPTDTAKVSELARSIKEVGLMVPPAICMRNGVVMDDGEPVDGVAVLIYGRHRLAALQSLGETHVECSVFDVDDLHAELMEIDENLARSELTPAQEAAHIARRKEIWEEIERKKTGGRISPTSLADGRGAGPQHKRQFASELASVMGDGRNPESVKRDINLKLRRVENLGDDIHRIVGTSLDKGVEMDALIKMPEQERANLIAKAEAGEAVSARPAPPPKPVTTEKALAQMTRDLEARAEGFETEVDRIAEEIIERYGEDEMPFLLNFLIPKVAAAIRRRLT